VTASTARAAALTVVTRVRERGAFAHETLNTVLASSSLSAQDVALATRLAYGTVACRGTLDDAVDRFTDAPGRVEPRVKDALAVGAYELLFLHTPAWAAVNEGVELVRGVRPRAAGLANAVLRRLGEARDAFPWGDPASDDAALARMHAHPEWLTRVLVEQLGRTVAEAVLEADNEPAPLYMAHLPFRGSMPEAVERLTRDGAQPELCELTGCIVARSPAAAVAGAALREGRVIVCDAAAQFVARAVRPEPGMRIVDIGSGRGTKTLIIQAAAMESGGPALITAVDRHGFKLDVLGAAVEQLGVPGIRTVEADATALGQDADLTEDSADGVLVDAPCSGLGTLRRHPDKRWRLVPQDIQTLALLNRRLLSQAALLVSPGGFVVYSTCTLTRQENDGVVADFLGASEGQEFSIESLASDVPRSWSRFLRDDGTFQSLPELGGPDGHFVARLRRAP